MKIVRTKRPNILVLNDKYEDDAAQEIIDNKFGKNFDMTGYIRQGSQKSFILFEILSSFTILIPDLILVYLPGPRFIRTLSIFDKSI